MRWWRAALPCLGMCLGCVVAKAQAPLSLDTTFRLDFQSWYVNSIMQLVDGDLILSGRLRVEGEWSDRGLVKVDPNTGTYIPVPGVVLVGGGKLTRWEDKYYVGAGQTVMRLNGDALRDTTFDQPDTDPTFTSFQGGDYHVYPDGRLLISGLHDLIDEQGVGRLHSLIWFTDSGWVDYSRTHRRSNAAIYQIEEEPDGQFLCFYTGTEYEEQPTNGRIFRINADGTLDPTLESRVTSGRVFSFLPLPDGRFYAAGNFNRNGTTTPIKLARFLPSGELDPTFDHTLELDLGEIQDPGSGGIFSEVQPWRAGQLLVLGTFQYVEGEPRRGICVLDSTGALWEEFDACGVGPYTYEGFTYGSVSGYLETPDGMAYIWGAYHGYNDGTTNDTLQRFVSRLYGPDWSTQVREEETAEPEFSLHPNPAQEQVTISIPDGQATAHIRVRDHLGRVVLERHVGASSGQLVIDSGALAPGAYLVEIHDHGLRLTALQLVLQP